MMFSVLTSTTPQHIKSMDYSDHQQYGVLPWRMGRQGDLRILLITDRKRQEWGVPGGWPTEGQVSLMSAALDAFDEAGIIGEINPEPLTSYGYSNPTGEEERLVHRITLLAMRVRGTLLHWKEYGKRQRRWFSANEAVSRLEGTELAGIIDRLVSSPQTLTRRTDNLNAAGSGA